MIKKGQVFLSWLPGYFFDGRRLRTSGAALEPTMHVNPENGEIRYYARPLFENNFQVGLFVRHQGIVDAISRGDF